MIVWHKTQWNVWNGKIGKVDIHCNIKSAVMISIRALRLTDRFRWFSLSHFSSMKRSQIIILMDYMKESSELSKYILNTFHDVNNRPFGSCSICHTFKKMAFFTFSHFIWKGYHWKMNHCEFILTRPV